MKKIFALIGSEKKGKSNTYQYANLILERVRCKYQNGLEINIMVAGNREVYKCQECKGCFETGECLLDERDYMQEIKEKMLSADIIVLGCGVYFQHISSEMKNIIDRLAYWSHIFALAGKQCVILTTSGSNGNEFAEAYLKRISLSLGMQIVGCSYCRVEYPKELHNWYFIEDRVEQIAEVIIRALKNEISIKSNEFQERLFSSMKEIYKTHSEFIHEIEVWRRNELFQCESFEDVMCNVKRKNRNKV